VCVLFNKFYPETCFKHYISLLIAKRERESIHGELASIFELRLAEHARGQHFSLFRGERELSPARWEGGGYPRKVKKKKTIRMSLPNGKRVKAASLYTMTAVFSVYYLFFVQT
jgi:hypothetical protein